MKTICFFLFCLMIVTIGCKQRYNPPVSSPPTGYLVVEGFINNGVDPTIITLSRTTPLYDTSGAIEYEQGAQVSIESNNNENYALNETSPGVYASQSSLSLNNNKQYRLHIITANGNEYESDYTQVRSTPPIDSISWQKDNNGVHIYISTHDSLNNVGYYQWYYEETWEYHSAYVSTLLYVITSMGDSVTYSLGYRFPNQTYDSTIFKCWHSPHSTSILLGSSEKLTTDKIYQNLINIPSGSQQLSVLYSVKMYQHAISKSNYEFLQKMKKNTEQVGSIFDAQPSELKGNIHCVNNPDNQVIGFMEVSQFQTSRIFISNEQVPDWGYKQPCQEIEISNTSDDIKRYGIGLIPTTISGFTFDITKFYAAEPECVDCTLTGSNVRPSFWP